MEKVLLNIQNFFQNNPIFAMAMSFGGAGIVSFWLKDVPKSIYNLLRRELTTELTITSQNAVFYDFLKWIERNYGHKNFRRLKVCNGKWGSSDEKVTTSIGYGTHFIRYKQTIFLITLNKESANQTERDKETITLIKLGRKRKVFDDFIKDVVVTETDLSKTKIYKMEDYWTFTKDQTKRNIDSIFIEDYKKELLLKSLDKFINNERWYLDNGIPYQLGILLYGPPGTGKTSLIKAIAGYLNYPIFYLHSEKLYKIELAMSTLPDNCIVVIEDIDSNSVTHTRIVSENDNKIRSKENENIFESFRTLSLSEILNSLDGIFSVHGRILIATTNHIESLDAALIRPGRIDIKVEIGFVNFEILKKFIGKFFPTYQLENIKIKPNTTIATLQNMILQGANVEEIINFVQDK